MVRAAAADDMGRDAAIDGTRRGRSRHERACGQHRASPDADPNQDAHPGADPHIPLNRYPFREQTLRAHWPGVGSEDIVGGINRNLRAGSIVSDLKSGMLN